MNKTLKLTCTAMMCALAVLANLFTVPLTPNFSKVISFTITVTVLAGAYLGPVCGAAVGFLGDLIAHFINPMGGMSYNWFIGLSCLLTGLFAGLIFRTKLHKQLKLVVTLVLCFAVCTTLLNNFGLWLQIIVGVKPSPSGLIALFTTDPSSIRKTFWAYALARTPVALLNTAINGVIVAAILQTSIIDKIFAKFTQSQAKRGTDASATNIVDVTDATSADPIDKSDSESDNHNSNG